MTVEGRVEPGSVLAGYRVVELAGRGGTGEVYRAHDGRLDRDVAIKVLSDTYASDLEFRGSLIRESRLAASLNGSSCSPVASTVSRLTSFGLPSVSVPVLSMMST